MKAKQRKKIWLRVVLYSVGGLAILTIATLLIIPSLVSSAAGRRFILAKINNSTGGQADFESLSMGWRAGIKLTNFSFQNATETTSVKIKKIAIKPHYTSILTGSLSFGRTVIEKPEIEIYLKHKQQREAVSSSGQATKISRPQAIALPIAKIDLVITDGTLKIAGQDSKTVELRQINSKVNLRPPGQKTQFDVNMNLADGAESSKIKAEGEITLGKKKGWSLKGISGRLSVEIEDLNVGSLGPFLALAGPDIHANGRLSAKLTGELKDGQFKDLKGSLKAKGLDITMVNGKPVVFSQPINMEAEIRLDDSKVVFDRMEISSAFCTFNCSGRVRQLRYDGRIDLAKLQRELGQIIEISPHTISGEVVGGGEIALADGVVSTFGSAVVNNLSLRSAEGLTAFEPKAELNFAVKIKLDDKLVQIDSINAVAGLGEIKIKNAIVPYKKSAEIPMKLTVFAEKIDLAKLQPFLVLLASFPQQMQLAGMVESQITVTSKADIYRISSESTKIKNLRVDYPGQQPFVQDSVLVVFDAELDPVNKEIAVEKFELISPQIKIKKGEFHKKIRDGQVRLQGRLDCEYDWAAISTVAGPFLPAGLRLYGNRSDTISFATEYPIDETDKLLANLDTSAKVGFERADYMGLQFGPTEVDIKISKGQLSIPLFSAAVNNGQVSFAGEADLRQQPRLLKISQPIQMVKDVHIDDRVTQTLLQYINPIFADAVNVSGIANFNCEHLVIPLGPSRPQDIEVVGTVSITDMRLQASDLLGQIFSFAGAGTMNQNITIRPTRFVLKNGFLQYDNMQIDIGNNPVNFRGVIGLDKSLNMSVLLPYTTVGRTARIDDATDAGRISLPLRGTIDHPELDLGKLLEDQLKQQLQQRLREGLEGLFK